VVILPPLIYFAGRIMGHSLGYGWPTSFDREVLDLLIVRDEDTAAIWTAVYSSLQRSSHPVFREYVVREMSAGRALAASEEALGDLFIRELYAAWRKEEMPDNYLRLITDYLRRHLSQEKLESTKLFFSTFRPRNPVRIGVRDIVLKGFAENQDPQQLSQAETTEAEF
jgi:hypothetical protein